MVIVVLTCALLTSAAAAGGPVPDDAVLPPLGEAIPNERLGMAMPIENPPGQNALRQFHLALVSAAHRWDDPQTRTREDQARVVVWGASHVAGDMFTALFRNELKARFGDAGIGLIVPASPWRDYNNRDANISFSDHWDSSWVSRRNRREDGRYGLAGVVFEGEKKAAWARVSTAKSSAFGREVDRIEVWYWRDDRGGDFVVNLDKKKSKRVKTKVDRKKGEVPGFAVWSLDVPLGRHEVEIRPVGNGKVTLFGVVLDKKGPGVVMDSLGINGARATDQLEWDAGLFTQQLQRRDPDLVVLAYGTNDIGDDEPVEEYERKLDVVINRVRSAVPEASCLFVGPSDRPVRLEVDDETFAQALAAKGLPASLIDEAPTRKRKKLLFQRRPRQQLIIDAQKKVAWRYGCGYWNWAGAMGGDLSMLKWVHAETPLGAPDYVHLTRGGYERIGQLFWDAVMGPFEGGIARSLPEGPSLRQRGP